MGQVAYTIAAAALTTATSEAIIKEAIHAGVLTLRRAGHNTEIILHVDLEAWATALPSWYSVDEALSSPRRIGLA